MKSMSWQTLSPGAHVVDNILLTVISEALAAGSVGGQTTTDGHEVGRRRKALVAAILKLYSDL